jgi:serine/threonine protein kinase
MTTPSSDSGFGRGASTAGNFDARPVPVPLPSLSLTTATGPVSAAEPDAGQTEWPRQLGEYRIVRVIGHGGMGVVFEAVQESLGRRVALKVLSLQSQPSPIQVQRFQREAKAAAALHHSNIVPVFGVGKDHGIHYYAMQFIQGQGLDKVLDDVRWLRHDLAEGKQTEEPLTQTLSARSAQGLLSGKFPGAATDADGSFVLNLTAPVLLEGGPAASQIGERSSIAYLPIAAYYRSVATAGAQVAEALAYAHGQGILHRDIKPSNLLLDTRGTVWITDFGLAKVDDSTDLTQQGDLIGTIRFMAPERLEGVCDVRSEVYSVGATLYEMVTLRHVFTAADQLALLEQVRSNTPLRPRRYDARVPRDLEKIILKAMARDPAERYASSAALAEDLRLFLADPPVRARRASPVEQIWL